MSFLLNELLFVVMALVFFLLLLEIVFRVVYRRRHNRPYHVAIKFPWDRSYVVSHPFLSFSYKENEVIDHNQKLPYALSPNKYYSFKNPLKLNNEGHFGADFFLEKPVDSLRIACIGSSGTANNIADEKRDYCYPDMLQEKLREIPELRRCYSSIDVYNCGIGGWTTVDVFINFAITILHYKPDYVIFYQGLNDLPLYLMDDFRFDYRHGRRNLGERLHIIKRGYYPPKLRFWHSYEFVKDRLLGTGNVRNEVLAAVERRPPDFRKAYRPLVTEEMALRNLLVLARHHGVKPILSSYVFYLHNGNERNHKLHEGVQLENAMYRRLAGEFAAPFVDQDALMPRDPRFFVDAVHFTPEGMERLAEHFAQAVIADLTQSTTIAMEKAQP